MVRSRPMNDSPSSFRPALIQCGIFTLVAIVLWGVLLVPAYAVAGFKGLEGVTISAALCIPPGWLALLSGSLPSFTPASSFLVGMISRMTTVLGGVLLLQNFRPDLGFKQFTVWLIVFYMLTLLIETVLVLQSSVKPAEPETDETNK